MMTCTMPRVRRCYHLGKKLSRKMKKAYLREVALRQAERDTLIWRLPSVLLSDKQDARLEQWQKAVHRFRMSGRSVGKSFRTGMMSRHATGMAVDMSARSTSNKEAVQAALRGAHRMGLDTVSIDGEVYQVGADFAKKGTSDHSSTLTIHVQEDMTTALARAVKEGRL